MSAGSYITGVVIVKNKRVTIRREAFSTKGACKEAVERFLKQYPNYEITVKFDQ